MLDNQSLFKQIPKHIQEWTQQDVAKWFRINQIQIDDSIKISGKQFISLTSARMIKEMKFSNFLARKISDWLQFQISQFEEYVDEASKNQIKKFCLDQPTQNNQLKAKSQNNDSTSIKIDDSLKNFPQELQKHLSQESKVSFNCLQLGDQSEQIYKSLKYKAPKSSQHQKIVFDNSTNQISCLTSKQQKNQQQQSDSMAKNKKQLIFKQLMQKEQQPRQDVQTCKQIPQKQQSQYFSNDLSLFQKINQNSSLSCGVVYTQSESSFYNNVRFVSSQLMLVSSTILIAEYQSAFCQIQKTVKIGRSTTNDIVMKSQGVSRFHAMVQVEQQVSQQGQTVKKRYFIKDTGSKFGTFIQFDPQKPKKVSEGQSFCIGQATIRIDKLKMSKSRQRFDLTLSIIQSQQQQRSFSNRSIVTIGNKKREIIMSKEQKSSQITKRSSNNNHSKQKQKRDLQFQDSFIKNYHCRFTIIGGEVYLEQVEGNFLQKIGKNVKYQLVRNQHHVKLGDGDLNFKLQKVYRPVIQSIQ